MQWEDLTITDLEILASPAILERGRVYLAEGHLRRPCRVGTVLAGELIGGGADYRSRLWIEQQEIHWECNCPYPDFCKHLTALTLAWLERREEFRHLDGPLTELLDNPTTILELLRQLIAKDPLNFLEIIESSRSNSTQISNRGVLNLIRTVFKRSYLKIGEAEALWEQMQRVQGLVAERIGQGDPEALELFRELFIGLLKNSNDTNRQIMQDYCQTLMPIIKEIPVLFTGSHWQLFGEELLDYYFTPEFWDQASLVREALKVLAKADRDWLGTNLEQRLNGVSNYLTLIATYELLADCFQDCEWVRPYFDRTVTGLLKTTAGRLWLIDRLWETEPETVARLLKEGLRTEEVNVKRAFRERLINFHQQRSEFKQAASLSYLHFQEEPTYEEYFRIKELLRKYPGDWESYLQKLRTFLTERGQDLLLLQIAISERDFTAVDRSFQRIKSNPADLITVAKFFKKSNLTELSRVLVGLIEALLEEGTSLHWNWAFTSLARFKKECLLGGRLAEWDELRVRLSQIYGANPKFNLKFGSILNSDQEMVSLS